MIALDLERDGIRDTAILRLHGDANLAFDPESAAHEHRLLEHLAVHGIPAPPPRLLDTSRALLPVDYLVLGWLDGDVDVAPADRSAAALAMADMLARVHEVPVTPSLGFLPAGGDAHDLLAGAVPVGHPVTLAPPLVAGLARLRARFPAPPPVLLHGDFWPGNMLWRDGALVAALDWEDAMTGDPLFDVAVARLDIAIVWGEPAMDAFTRRYLAATGRDGGALPLWDLVAARRAPVDYAEWAQDWSDHGRPDKTAATMEAGRRAVATAALRRVAGDLQAASA